VSLEDPRGIKLTLGIYLTAFSVKAVGFLMTGFIALLADGLNSLTDIAMALMMLASFRLARVPADESHPFGHGRGENAAALVAGVAFITVVAFGILREAVPRLLEPGGVPDNPEVAFAALGFSFLMNGLGIVFLYRELKRGSSPASKALLVDLVNDQISIGAAVTGILGATYGYPVVDPLAGIVIAVIISYTAYELVKSNVIVLMGASPGSEFYGRVEEVVMEVDGVEGVHDVMGEYIGPEKVHVDLHIRVDAAMTVEEADPLTEKVASRIKDELPQVVHAMVHVCPHGGERRATVE